MPSLSKNTNDVYTWINKIIESSETHEQLNSSSKLIYNFYKQYKLSYIGHLVSKLNNSISIKLKILNNDK